MTHFKALINGPYKKECPYGHDRLQDGALDISGGCIVCKGNRTNLYHKNNITKGKCFSGCGRPLFTKFKCKYHNQLELDRAKLYIKSLHDLVINEYGGMCNCCKYKQKWALQIDHTNNDGNIQRKFIKGITFYNYILGCYPKDLQILCANCNYGKRIGSGICPHKKSR